MSLFLTTIITGLVLIALGVLFLRNSGGLEVQAKGFLRSQKAAWVLFGGAGVWFLWHISQLGAADFGEYKNFLFMAFGGIAIGSFIFVKDFLAVRGLAVLLLLGAYELLGVAYMQVPTSRLFLVVFAYMMIILGLYWGAIPYKLRDHFNCLFAKAVRVKLLGGILAGYGVLLAVIAFTY